MTWDAKECIRLISDNTVKYSAEEILDKIIKYDKEPCEEELHFFTVELHNIRKENNELLDAEGVKEYISINAPVPYNNNFWFRGKINEYLRDKGLSLSEYKIFVDGEDILKSFLQKSSFFNSLSTLLQQATPI